MSREVKILLDQLEEDMKSRPLDFHENGYRLVDTKTKVEYWIGNGFLFYGAHHPIEVKFNLFEKFRFASLRNKVGCAKIVALSQLQND
jgi:hypothetical protein